MILNTKIGLKLFLSVKALALKKGDTFEVFHIFGNLPALILILNIFVSGQDKIGAAILSSFDVTLSNPAAFVRSRLLSSLAHIVGLFLEWRRLQKLVFSPADVCRAFVVKKRMHMIESELFGF